MLRWLNTSPGPLYHHLHCRTSLLPIYEARPGNKPPKPLVSTVGFHPKSNMPRRDISKPLRLFITTLNAPIDLFGPRLSQPGANATLSSPANLQSLITPDQSASLPVWITTTLPSAQHGGIPGRGIHTALIPFLTSFEHQLTSPAPGGKQFLGSADLSKAFDRLAARKAIDALDRMQLPHQVLQPLRAAWTNQRRWLLAGPHTADRPPIPRSCHRVIRHHLWGSWLP